MGFTQCQSLAGRGALRLFQWRSRVVLTFSRCVCDAMLQDDGEDAMADAAAGAPAVSASALNMQKMLADFGLPDLYSHLSTIGSLLRHLRRPFPDSPVTTWTLKFPEPLEVLYFNFFFAQDLRRFQRSMFMTIVACIGIILINVRALHTCTQARMRTLAGRS